MSNHAAPATITEAVEDFRDANRRIRVMVKNGGLTGRNAGATRRGIDHWQTVADRAMRFILDSGERRIAGWLTEEAGVIDNIAKSVTERPELKHRLVIVRRDVRRRLEHLAAVAA